jgi:hypothetical protein
MPRGITKGAYGANFFLVRQNVTVKKKGAPKESNE